MDQHVEKGKGLGASARHHGIRLLHRPPPYIVGLPCRHDVQQDMCACFHMRRRSVPAVLFAACMLCGCMDRDNNDKASKQAASSGMQVHMRILAALNETSGQHRAGSKIDSSLGITGDLIPKCRTL